MKPMKMFGLALVAAVAAMALVGASSALAESTALCKVNENPCALANQYPAGTIIEAQLLHQTESSAENLKNVSPSLLLGPNLVEEVRCWESSASGETTTGLATPLEGKLTGLSFGHCFHKTGVGCTVTVNQLGTLTLLKTGANLGEAKVNGVLVTVVCGVSPVVLECVYKTEALPMAAKGTGPLGEVAELTADHAKLTKEGIGISCPSEGFFDAKYEIVEPAAGYITS